MRDKAPAQTIAFAVVNARSGGIAVFHGMAPIYWRKYNAQHEADRQNGGSPGRSAYRVAKVIISAPEAIR